jgi:RHS repeat-associated protein
MGRPTVIEYGHASTLSQDASYDSLGRLTGLERPLGASRPAALSATVANSWGWTLDGANDWDSVDSTGGAVSRDESRVHDDTHALKEVYDAVSSTTELLGHDWNGNLIWDDSFDYVFDAYNRLRHVSDRATGNVIAVYDYDVEDRRIRKSVTHSGALNGVTMFVYDAEDVVAEYDDAGTLLREFVHGPGYDEVLVMNRNTGGGTTATGPGDERYYYTHDALGSTVALVSAATGKAVEGYLYEPYGATYVVEAGANGQVDWGGDDTIASHSGLDNPYTFTGQRFDAETGLMYYKARYYSSEQGRFISRDPIGIWTDEVNLGNGYAYVGSGPLDYGDPTGFWRCNWWLQWECDAAQVIIEVPAILGAGVVGFACMAAGASAPGHSHNNACTRWARGAMNNMADDLKQTFNPDGHCTFTDKFGCAIECARGDMRCALWDEFGGCMSSISVLIMRAGMGAVGSIHGWAYAEAVAGVTIAGGVVVGIQLTSAAISAGSALGYAWKISR